MPVSKHRRRSTIIQAASSPAASRHAIKTIDDLRQAMANPTLDYRERVVTAGVWWFEQLLRKAGDPWQSIKSGKDRMRAALLLCVAMDGAHGQNDDLAPFVAALLRPYCPAATFAEAWERVNHLPPGTVVTMAARIVNAPPSQRRV